MSVNDETWGKCNICGETWTGNNAYQHGLGVCKKPNQHMTAIQKALLQNSPDVKLKDIGFNNIMSLGQAIEAAGGNAFFVLKDYRDLLTNLECNNISITAKYHGPRKS